MRKFAKISAIFVALFFVFSFSGCSDGGSSSDDVTVDGSSSGSETGGSSGGSSSSENGSGSGNNSGTSSGSGSSSSGNSGNSGSTGTGGSSSSGSGSGSESGTSSTKNILAGKTYYSIDFEKKEYTSELINKAKIRVGMFAFDSNGQKIKYTELAYDFKNGTVEKDNIIESDEFDYSVSGSTLTVKADGDGEDLICTINSDGSIKDEEGSAMKEFKGNLYAVAEAESNEKRILAKAHIVIVNGASCTYENRIFKSNATPQESTEIVNGTVSGNTLTFTFTEDGETETASGSLSDEKVVIDTGDGDSLTLKRM